MRDDDATAAADANYGYVPQESVAILFLSLYGISTILHIGQATYYRMWWLLPTAALCGVGELVGWGGRFWSSLAPTANTPFIIQTCATILAPTPLLAASFTILSRIIQQLGTSYSLLTPKWYTRLFLPCDVLALVVQGVGGGMASSANDLAGANGAHVMLGGIGFQFSEFVIIVYSTLACNYVLRYLRDRPLRGADLSPRGALTPRLKIMLVALGFSTAVLFIRSIYRIVELSGGWGGVVIRTEVYFNVFDGGMVVLAIFTLNFAHPGVLLVQPSSEKKEAIRLHSRENSREFLKYSAV
ncbi:RTA1 like protein-domain-containing protein [Mycena epipterygia]|nr:RTA1 like protein-domain-containing protein [Mycena epipterygia]